MADPVVTACPADTITQVATNVTAATLRVISNAPKKYSWSYNATGTGVPGSAADFVPLLDNAPLSFAAAADVYVYADGGLGSIRTDT